MSKHGSKPRRRKPRRVVRESTVDDLPFEERIDLAHTTLTFRTDFDKLLTARGVRLWLEWRGKWLMLQTEIAGVRAAIYRFSLKHGMQRIAAAEADEDFRTRLLALMKLHKAKLLLGFDGDLGKAHFLFPEASENALSLYIETREGKPARYVTDAEES